MHKLLADKPEVIPSNKKVAKPIYNLNIQQPISRKGGEVVCKQDVSKHSEKPKSVT